MKITFHKYYIQIQSYTLCNFVDILTGIKNSKAGASWPFLYLRYPNHPMNEIWINHEKIHFAQQFEFLLIFWGILYYLEIFYFRIFMKMNAQEAYLNSTFEQECYIHQVDLKYLQKRKPYEFFKYFLKDKKHLIKRNSEGYWEAEKIKV